MLPHCVWSLPPKGAAFCLGAARRQNRAPTLPHCVWSLPPKGAAFCLGAARRQNQSPHAPSLRVVASPKGALAPWGGPAALVGVSA
jgi:hypothetical protein